MHAMFLGRGMVFSLGIALFASSGCGDEKDPAKFIGTWAADSVLVSPTCNNTALPPQTLMNQMLTFTAGTSSDLVGMRGDECAIKFDIDGSTATAQAGQTCSATIPNPLGGAMIGATLVVDKATFTVVGTRGTYNQNGGATLTVPIPGFMGCTYTIAATANKKP